MKINYFQKKQFCLILFFITLFPFVGFSQNLIWAKAMGDYGQEAGIGMAVDPQGNMYSTGYFQYSFDFDPGAGVTTLTTDGVSDCYINKMDPSGNLLWVKRIGGPSEDRPTGLTLDKFGNVYTIGTFLGTVDFDPGVDSFKLTTSAPFTTDFYILKLDANGNFKWAKRIGGIGNDYAHAITTDNNGNVYTTGSYISTVDFDPGAGAVNFTSTGLSDVFILKLDSNGNYVWARRFGASDDDAGKAIAVDDVGNVYTAGGFRGNVDFDPGSGSFPITYAGAVTIYLQKLTSSGAFVWAKAMGGAGGQIPQNLVYDKFNRLVLGGYFMGQGDFDPGAGVRTLSTMGYYDIFISTFDTAGNLRWVKQLGGDKDDIINGMITDASGNILFTGCFYGTADFDPGPASFTYTSIGGNSDVFVAKLDSIGTFLMAKQMGGYYVESGLAIAEDASENLFLTGYFTGPSDYEPGPGVYTLNSKLNSNDLFILKMNQKSTIGISGNTLQNDIGVFPNPSHNLFNIDFGDLYTDAEIKIENILGQEVNNLKYTNTRMIQISLNQVPGIYFITIQLPDGLTKVFKVVNE